MAPLKVSIDVGQPFGFFRNSLVISAFRFDVVIGNVIPEKLAASCFHPRLPVYNIGCFEDQGIGLCFYFLLRLQPLGQVEEIVSFLRPLFRGDQEPQRPTNSSVTDDELEQIWLAAQPKLSSNTQATGRSFAMYPKPDRSDHKVQGEKHEPPYDFIDIGWGEGFFADTRPFRAECWADRGITMLTFFFSRRGLETSTESELKALLERERLIKFSGEEVYLTALPMSDASGNEMWSVNIVVGDERRKFLDSFSDNQLKLHPYSRN